MKPKTTSIRGLWHLLGLMILNYFGESGDSFLTWDITTIAISICYTYGHLCGWNAFSSYVSSNTQDSVLYVSGLGLNLTPTEVPSKTRTTQAFLTYVRHKSTLSLFLYVSSVVLASSQPRVVCGMLMTRSTVGLGRAPIVLTLVCAAAASTIVFVHHNQESEKEV